MSLPQPSEQRPAPSNGRRPGAPVAARKDRTDWDVWLRAAQRKRRALARLHDGRHQTPPRDYYARATWISFRMDGVHLTKQETSAALSTRTAAPKAFRPRQAQRIRNHAAVLKAADLLLRRGKPLRPDTVLRWYASIACGLSTAHPDDPTLARLGEVVARTNSPHLRLRGAVEDVARLHHRLLTDPFVPSFNGILARVLLHYHLGRCGLPPVLFDPETDTGRVADGPALLRRLLDLIEEGYDRLLGG